MDTQRRRLFAALARALAAEPGRVAEAALLMALAKACAVAVPLLLKAVIDRFGPPPATADTGGGSLALVLPVSLLLAYAVVRFAATLFNEWRDARFAPVALAVASSYAERAFAKLMTLDAQFHLRRSTGVLLRDVERGVSGVGFLLGAGLFTVVPTLLEFIAVLCVLALGYGFGFVVVVLVTFAFYACTTLLLTTRRELRQRRVNDMDSKVHGRLVDCLMNVDAIRSHARERAEVRRYAQLCREWVQRSAVNQRALSSLHIGQAAVIAAGVAAVMLLAAEQTVRGAMTVGDLVLVNAYVIQICLPLNALGFVFREARDATVNAERLLRLLDEPVTVVDRPDAAELRVDGGHVRFEGVRFGYEPGRPVVQDITLAIPPGATLAIVGGSGSGKSTLARLLLRQHDVEAGRITIDGQDIRDVRQASLRAAIGVVPQDTVLFDDTIAYNIAYGRPGATHEDVVAAAGAAQVHEFVMSLPRQYDTGVGERGLKLSGGERQRIAIARVLLRDPPLMVLDEATSALDTRSERAIQARLDHVARGRTTLVIAHRLSTVVDADEIVVLDAGRIVERGRHQALLTQRGLYARLWSLQREQQAFEQLERRLARQPVDLAALLSTTVQGLRETLDRRRVRLVSDVDLSAGAVTGDLLALSAALRTAFVACLAATPDGGRIALTLSREAGRVRLSLADGRVAGTLDAWPAAPEPAGDEPPLDPLALRSTIERQGGRFEMLPPREGQGLRYVFLLPVRAVASAADAGELAEPAGVEGSADAAPLAGRRVLLVDDDAEALEALGVLLRAVGAEVTSHLSGAPLLAWLEATPVRGWPDVLVCDLMIGAESGHDVMRRVREIEVARGVDADERLPAVALSGLSRPEDRVQALLSGFQAYLEKPVTALMLVTTLHTLVRGSGSRGG